MLVQGVARAVGDAVLRQHHGQVFFRHRHGTVLVAMDDGNRGAPIALAAHAPVTQTPGDFFLAQAFGADRQFGHFGRTASLKRRPSSSPELRHTPSVWSAYHSCQAGSLEGLAIFDADHLRDGQLVLQGKRKIALVVRGHTHDRAVAIAHEHIVAHPHRHLCAGHRVRDKQARGHAHLVFHRQLGLGGAALFALFQ